VGAKPNEENYMLEKIMAACSVAIVLIGLSLYSLGGHAQSEQMARHEPHMSAAYGHLQQARAELDKASPNKGGHREKAIQLVDQAMQEVQAGEAYDQERPK
jgi:hypothetical protein